MKSLHLPLLVCAAAGVLLSCERRPEATPQAAPEPELPREPAGLAAAMRGAPSASRAVDIVHAMLSLSGVELTGHEGGASEAGERVAPMRRHVLQTHAAAREARAGMSRLTLAQVAELLWALDFPLDEMAAGVRAEELKQEVAAASAAEEASGGPAVADAGSMVPMATPPPPRSSAGRGPATAQPAPSQLALVLRALVTEARAEPDAPGSAPLLLLDELARLQEPALDLTGDYHPGDLRWGLLELDLFLAAFAALAQIHSTHSAAMARPAVSFASTPLRVASAPLPTDACSKLLGGADGLGAVEWAVGDAGGDAIKKHLPESAKKALKGVGALNQLIALAQLHAFTTVRVDVVTESPTHKVVEGEAARKGRFRATVEVDTDIADLLKRVKDGADPSGLVRLYADCSGAIGTPTTPSLDALVNDVPSWQVEWELDVEPSGLVTWGYDGNELEAVGSPTTKLTPGGRGKGTAEFVVEIGKERKELHEARAGKQKTGRAVATAKVKSSKPPSFGFLLGGKDPIGGITEMLSGLARELFQPKGHASLPVTYHSSGGYLVDHRWAWTRIYGRKCGSFVGRWDLAVAGGGTGFRVTRGFVRFKIEEDHSGLFESEQRIITTTGLSSIYQSWGPARFDWHRQVLTVEQLHSEGTGIVRGRTIPLPKPPGGSADLPVTWSPDACGE